MRARTAVLILVTGLIGFSVLRVPGLRAQARATGGSVGAQSVSPTVLSDEAILQRAADYVDTLQIGLSQVIADETTNERVEAWKGNRAQLRTLKSERLLWWLADEGTWLSVRNIRSMDGRSIPDSQSRLERVLAGDDAEVFSRLRALREEGARFDIGHVFRTTSDPLLVVQFLGRGTQERFDFRAEGASRVQGMPARRFSFVERMLPSVVVIDAKDALSTGRVWLRETDGAILQTEVEVSSPEQNASVSTDFVFNPKLDLWVPSRMRERYAEHLEPTTMCVTTYNAYRRFETAAHLVDQQ
jgi:hypothetical protein